MSDLKMKIAAIDEALVIGQQMAEELRDLAADIGSSSGDAADAAWIYELVSRWENAAKVLNHA